MVLSSHIIFRKISHFHGGNIEVQVFWDLTTCQLPLLFFKFVTLFSAHPVHVASISFTMNEHETICGDMGDLFMRSTLQSTHNASYVDNNVLSASE